MMKKSWISWMLIVSMIITMAGIDSLSTTYAKAQTGRTVTISVEEGEWTKGNGDDSRLEFLNEQTGHVLPYEMSGATFTGIDITFKVIGMDDILESMGMDHVEAVLNFYSDNEKIKNIINETGNVSTDSAKISGDGTYTVSYEGNTRISLQDYLAVRFAGLDDLGKFPGTFTNVRITLYNAIITETPVISEVPVPVDPEDSSRPAQTKEPLPTGHPDYQAEQQTKGTDDDFRVGISYVNTEWEEVYYTDFSTTQVMQITHKGSYSISYTIGQNGSMKMLWLDSNLYKGSKLQIDVTGVCVTTADNSKMHYYTLENGQLREPGSLWGFRDSNKDKQYAATVKNPFLSYMYYVEPSSGNYKPEYEKYSSKYGQEIDTLKGCDMTVTSGSALTVDFVVRDNPDAVSAEASATPQPTDEPDITGLDANDVSALKELIRLKKVVGADVSGNITDDEYTWDNDGRLIEINWNDKGLKGKVSLNGLPKLQCFYADNNKLTSIDASENTLLQRLLCGNNKIKTLNLQTNTNLQQLRCNNNELTELDVSNNAKLTALNCQKNNLSTIYVNETIQENDITCDSDVVIKRKTAVVSSQKPVGSNKPSSTPKVTKTPETSKSPSNTPKVTKTPETSKSPSNTPKVTKTPETSKSPSNTPKVTKTPETSKSPSNTPKVTKTPETSKSPSNTPKVTKEPEASKTPGNTSEVTKEPETSKTPGNTPEVTKEPETSHSPNNTPEVTKKPEISNGSNNTPEASSRPQSTPEITKAPEVTNMPDNTLEENQQSSNTSGVTRANVSENGGSYQISSSEGKNTGIVFLKPEDNASSDVDVPDTISIDGKDYKVTSIAADAFLNNKKLKKLKIGRNINKIGKNAFKNCKNLRKIIITSEKLKASSIGKNAFKGTSKKLVIKVPKKKYKEYKKFLKKKGNSGVRIIK